jgi:hypothetical protein
MKLKVPNKLSEIKLSQYVEYLNLIEKTKSKPDLDFINLKMIEIFCGVDYEFAKTIEYVNVLHIVMILKDTLDQKPDIKNDKFFKIDGKKFGFVPDLDKLKYGEFLDLNSNITDWNNMHISMGVLFRPVTNNFRKMYLVEDYKKDKYHSFLKDMPMSAVVGSMVFFWNLGIELLNSIPKYLEENQSQMNSQTKQYIKENGDGIQQSIDLLTMMLLDMTK